MGTPIEPGHGGAPGLWTDYILRDFVPGLTAQLFLAKYAEPAMIPRGAGGYVA